MPVPDYSDPTPAYVQVADDLRDLIAAGTFDENGGRLPPTRELAGEKYYKVADGTIRQAIKRLRAEGIVETRSTLGTFVVSKDAAAGRPDLSTVAGQVTELAELTEGYADLRAKVNLMEAVVMTLCRKAGVEYPHGGASDNAKKAPRRGQAGR